MFFTRKLGGTYMFKHYITIAIRNLLKYRSQSIISILGLAVGFTCFALSLLWIHYELTYDTFHKDADRINLIRTESNTDFSGLTFHTDYPLRNYLKKIFPEVEDACNIQIRNIKYKFNQAEQEACIMSVDSAIMHIFPIQILGGSKNFMIRDSKEIAITDRLAKQLFGSGNALGNELDIYNEKRKIGAIIKAWTLHSNLPFDILDYNEANDSWGYRSWQTFIKVRERVDLEAFGKKLSEHTVKEDQDLKGIALTPITAMRYDRPSREVIVRFDHIQLFALAAGLVVLCSLFNYLTLFISRVRMRGKEVVLRKICGSSNRNLLILFSIEYLFTLFFALFIGVILIELILPVFKELSEIKTNTFGIYMETLCYSLLVACLSFLFSLLPIYYFRRQTLNNTLKGSSDGKSRNIFQKTSMVLQLIISLGFIFCSTVFIKQIHFLNHTDLGMERQNRGSISIYRDIDGFKNELKNNPFITEVFPDNLQSLYPRQSIYFCTISEWDEKPASKSSIRMEMINCNPAYMQFYNLQLLKGKMPDENSKDQFLINEAALRELGINDPVGKTIDQTKLITGVYKDFYFAPPTIPAKPMLISFTDKLDLNAAKDILFKYQANNWTACKQEIEKLIKKMKPDASFTIWNLEEEYQKFLMSENALLKMLDFVTLVCIIISLFGVYSQMTLDCERQRKGIAVRKVNGATTTDIVRIFYRKYLLLLSIAAAVALPVSYLIMKSWIESYVIQTSIEVWIYPAILVSVALIIAICTGWRIWKAATANPAEVIKSE